jgi:hypothetical protein
MKSDSLCIMVTLHLSNNCKFVSYTQDYTFKVRISITIFLDGGGGGAGYNGNFVLTLHQDALYKIISFIVKPTFRYTPPFFFFLNTAPVYVFKYVSFSTVSFLGFSYSQTFFATDLFNRSAGGVEEQVNFNWNCA